LAKGVKLDNFVQIAHNVRVGEDTVIAAHTALAGSCKVGARVTMGGKVDVNNQVTVCDDATFGGRAGIAQDITEPGIYFGLPAKPIREATRVMMMSWKLPEYVDRIKSLEKRLEELEKK
jgi:UDP-3-O-[3-hydroxymyristoyl] glucosamine N-acyltransferase